MRSLLACIVIAGGAALQAQPSRLENAHVQVRAVHGDLEAQFRAIAAAEEAPVWVGYQEPIVPGHNQWCSEALEGRNSVTHLEGPKEFYVLYRIEAHKIGKIRTASPECMIDAGGLPLYWLTGVSAPESIAFLERLIGETSMHSGIAAIALHNDPAADTVLDRLVRPDHPEDVRRQAAFWLGNARGRHGFETLARVVRDDPSDRVREHAVFALTQSKEPGAIEAIIRSAHEDKSARVRGQALFWLAQRATHQIAATEIAAAIARDPETEVKRRAVFALTQIPNGDGVPLLIQVARTNSNPAVRKQAMFWLGQSKDPRALQFFEDVLTKN